MSAPAKTVVTRSGRVACSRANAMPGRARPAAHPQTEFTTIIVVPGAVAAASTSAAVRSSVTPRRVSSSRIGAIRNSGYATHTPSGDEPQPPLWPTGPVRGVRGLPFLLFAQQRGRIVAGLVGHRDRPLHARVG